VNKPQVKTKIEDVVGMKFDVEISDIKLQDLIRKAWEITGPSPKLGPLARLVYATIEDEALNTVVREIFVTAHKEGAESTQSVEHLDGRDLQLVLSFKGESLRISSQTWPGHTSEQLASLLSAFNLKPVKDEDVRVGDVDEDGDDEADSNAGSLGVMLAEDMFGKLKKMKSIPAPDGSAGHLVGGALEAVFLGGAGIAISYMKKVMVQSKPEDLDVNLQAFERAVNSRTLRSMISSLAGLSDKAA
jgi:hypothetical protein